MAFSYRIFLSLALLLLLSIHFIVSTAVATDGDISIANDELSVADNNDNINIADDDDDIQDDNSYEQEFLDAHNRAREAVKCKPVRWDKTLAALACKYAGKCKKSCRRVPQGHKYGHNTFIGEWKKKKKSNHTLATYALEQWVAEKKYYDYEKNKCAEKHVCKHYIQVVWKWTESIGCAIEKCKKKDKYVVVCKYHPKTNIKRPYLAADESDDQFDEEEEEEEEEESALIMKVTDE